MHHRERARRLVGRVTPRAGLLFGALERLLRGLEALVVRHLRGTDGVQASLASMPPPAASERSRRQKRAWAQMHSQVTRERNAAAVDDEMQTSTGDESLAMSTRSNTSTWDADFACEFTKMVAPDSEGKLQVRGAGTAPDPGPSEMRDKVLVPRSTTPYVFPVRKVVVVDRS